MVSWLMSFFSKKRIASNFFWSLLGEGAAKGVIFITNVHLARVLGVSNFGVFSVAQIITLYLWVMVDIGIGMYGIREIARRKCEAESIANPLITLRMMSGIFFFSVYSGTLFIMDMQPETRLVFVFSGLYLLTNSFYPDWVLKGLEKFKFIAVGSFITSGVFLASILVLVDDQADTALAALLSSLSFLCGSVALILMLKRITGVRVRPVFSPSLWLHHIRESVYFTVSGGFFLLYIFMPVLLLQFFMSSYEVGLFSAPYRIILAACSAGYLIPTAFYPALSEYFVKDREAFFASHKRLKTIMISIGTPIGVIGTVWGSGLVMLLFGNQYEESVGIFRVIVWLVPLVYLRYGYGNAFSAAGRQRLHNLMTMLGVIAIFALGPPLVMARGATGAAEAIVLSETITVAAMAYAFHRRIKRAVTPGYAA